VPDQAANRGYWQSLTDISICPLTCVRTGPGMAAHVLLSSRSRGRGAGQKGYGSKECVAGSDGFGGFRPVRELAADVVFREGIAPKAIAAAACAASWIPPAMSWQVTCAQLPALAPRARHPCRRCHRYLRLSSGGERRHHPSGGWGREPRARR
jgi:hypothetical protein